MSKQKLDAIRTKIAASKAQRAELLAMPRSREDIRAQLLDQLKRMAPSSDLARVAVRRVANGGDIRELFQAPVSAQGTAHIGVVLIGWFGVEVMAGALDVHVDALPEGVTKADRAARLAEIDSTLWELEVHEERLIVEAEGRGEYIERRSDANPAAVLWMPDEAEA
jgi:hypothetical protein